MKKALVITVGQIVNLKLHMRVRAGADVKSNTFAI